MTSIAIMKTTLQDLSQLIDWSAYI